MPWLAWAVVTHGPDVFVAAAGTHGGVGGGLPTLGDATFTLLPLAGAAYLLVADRDWFLAAWAVAAELLFAQPRFAFVVGSVVLATVAVDVGRRVESPERGRGTAEASRSAGPEEGLDGRAVLAGALLVVGATVGGAYLAHEMTLTNDPSTPEFLDESAVETADWAVAETPPDATFVVVGDAAEWFPALTGRTILVGPWGVEWRGREPYDRQHTAYEEVSRCHSADCIESVAASVGGSPGYVYLPKGQYTVLGANVANFGTLERSFARSSDWERAYENDGGIVYRRSTV
jgi:hypothetical protein